MYQKLTLIALILFFAACGDNPNPSAPGESSAKRITTSATSLKSQEANQSVSDTGDSNQTANHRLKTLILYIHGYNNHGADKHQVYGDLRNDTLSDAISLFTGYTVLESLDQKDFHNGIVLTTYYGDTPPAYYTPQDIEEVEAVTKRYGGGVPRYALIIGKFIRHAFKTTGADNVTIISGSMGSLVTRWLIEKDLAHLASDQKIDAWLSVNGVIRGNYPASQSDLVTLVNNIEEQPIDVEHMSYHWIEQNLHDPKSVADSPLYSHIRMGFVSSTQAGEPFGTLMKTIPNDGYQRLRDTFFGEVTEAAQYKHLPPTHTLFHQGHIGIKDYSGAWAQIADFLTSRRRVRITLTEATLDNLHEERMPLQNKTRAEAVFASTVVSDAVRKKWGIEAAISQRLLTGGALPVHYYHKAGETLHFSQILFDDFVPDDEQQLHLHMRGYELDDAIKYGIHEPLLGGNERLGETEITLPLKNGIYALQSDDYSGKIKVEVFDYPVR